MIFFDFRESQARLILSLAKDFEAKYKEIQDHQGQKLNEMAEKVNEMQLQNSPVKTLETSNCYSESIDQYRKESFARLASIEANFVLLKGQVLEKLESMNSRLNDYQQNVNLSFDIHSRDVKRLEREKATNEDLENVRDDLRTLFSNRNEEPLPKDFSALSAYLYQDSFADSSAALADSSSVLADSSAKYSKRINESRYALKPSSRLSGITDRLASLEREFFQKEDARSISSARIIYGRPPKYFDKFTNIAK